MRFLADSINMEDIKSALNFLTIEKGRFLFLEIYLFPRPGRSGEKSGFVFSQHPDSQQEEQKNVKNGEEEKQGKLAAQHIVVFV